MQEQHYNVGYNVENPAIQESFRCRDPLVLLEDLGEDPVAPAHDDNIDRKSVFVSVMLNVRQANVVHDNKRKRYSFPQRTKAKEDRNMAANQWVLFQVRNTVNMKESQKKQTF